VQAHRVAVRSERVEGAERLARRDPAALRHERLDRFVGRPQAVGVGHHHDRTSSELTGDGDQARRVGAHHLTGPPREVHAAVAG
jgi:hypothetical protein